MTLEELFFNTSVFRVYVGPYSYGELNYCDRLHILITFIDIITPLLTSTHKPVLARAPSSCYNSANVSDAIGASCIWTQTDTKKYKTECYSDLVAFERLARNLLVFQNNASISRQ